MAVSVTLDSNNLKYGNKDGRHMTFKVEQTGRSTGKWTLTVAGGTATNYSTGPTTATVNGTNVYYKKYMSGSTSATKPFPVSKGSTTGTFTMPQNIGKIPVSLLTWIWYDSGNNQSALTGTLNVPYTRLVYKPGGGTFSSSTRVADGKTYYIKETTSGYISYSTDKNETEALKQYVYYDGSKQDPYNYTTFNLVRTGYSFAGWDNSSTTSGAVATLNQNTDYYADEYEPDVKNASNNDRGRYVTLTAKWTANTYTVNFNVNGSGGSVSPTSKQVTYGSTYGTLPTPSRSGYTFAGWYTAASGGSIVTSSTIVNITSSQTLYAHWTQAAITNTISHWTWGYKYNEGTNTQKTAYPLGSTTFIKTLNDKYYLDANYCVAIPKGFSTPTQYGTSAISGSWANYPFTTQITQKSTSMGFEYDYRPISYSITYYDMGDGTTNNPTSYDVLYGVNFQNPTKNKTGYLFNKWTIDDNQVTGINVGANANFSSVDDLYSKCNSRTTGNKIVIANWTPKAIKVHYHYSTTDTSYAEQIFTYDQFSDGAAHFGLLDSTNNQIWDPDLLFSYADYAKQYGFGHWYWLGYKIIGWTDNKWEYKNDLGNGKSNGFVPVYNSWINDEYDEHSNHIVDLYPILEPIGTVRIWDGSAWQYAFPYVYDNNTWKQAEAYVNQTGTTTGWKIGV